MGAILRSENAAPDHGPGRWVRSVAILIFLNTLAAAPGWTVAAWQIPVQRPRPSRPASAASAKNALEAIRRVLDEQVAAWNRGDLDGFMRGYWKSDHLTFFSDGTVFRGWQATRERYRRTYQSEGKEMGQLEFSDLQIEQLGPRAASVTGRFRLRRSTGESRGLFTLIFRQTEEGWKIVHDHTSTAP
ncbi:MAG TPA: nuclear transport factor 2 family protein [Blastocatellia bacterium]|nr:nuclear transport factor 2 family protein [Blastocatellia bacterium]